MKTLTAFFAAAAFAASVQAHAAEGFIVADISLQSGPDDQYPPVDQLAAGTPVNIEGCLEGWTWCDVDVGDLRGWVPGTYIEQNYGGRWVYITDYGPRIGLPVVVFSLSTYWGTHYSHRPWFGERERWEARQIQPRMPTRPQGEAHAPPPRPMQRPTAPPTQPAPQPRAMAPPSPPANSPSQPAPAQANPSMTPHPETRSTAPDRSRETRTQPQNGAALAPPAQRPAPATPTSAPANSPPPAHRSANPPPPKPENKPKGEAKPPVKKDNQDRRDDNNGHDAQALPAG